MEEKTQRERELRQQVFKLQKEFDAYRKYNSYMRDKENIGATITLTVILFAIGGIMALMLHYGISV